MQFFLETPQGRFQFRRLPLRKHEPLQAWDAADEYLLKYLDAEAALPVGAKILIYNDSFGALSVALSARRPLAVSDSYLSQQATLLNLELNGIPRDSVRLIDSLTPIPEKPDCVLIKIPKTLALLEDQLHRLRPWLTPDTRIIAAAMVKNLPPSVRGLLEKMLGPTSASLAVKKARLLFPTVNPAIVAPDNPYPLHYPLENYDYDICNHANVFSRDSLDIGTRFLLQNLPANPGYRDYIDLGCGNGVVGLLLARNAPEAHIRFVDESFMAVASARENFQRAFGSGRQADFLVNDCLDGFPERSADCIVCNPPFHQQHAVGDQIAWRMFQQAHKVLRVGGELRVIGNRHLNYHISLNKLFGNVQVIANNPKFVILNCIKS